MKKYGKETWAKISFIVSLACWLPFLSIQRSHKILTWRNGSMIPDTLCSGLYPVMTKDLRFLTRRGMACMKMDQFRLITKPWEMWHSMHASIYNITFWPLCTAEMEGSKCHAELLNLRHVLWLTWPPNGPGKARGGRLKLIRVTWVWSSSWQFCWLWHGNVLSVGFASGLRWWASLGVVVYILKKKTYH